MSIEKTDFDEITCTDIHELVEDSISEGIRVEFKRELYAGGDSQKKELLKDVSAFANSHGGHLIIGIEEEKGVAVGVPGLADINPDEEAQKLEQSIQSGIEPRIPGIRIRAIPDDSKYVIVIRIPSSWNPPHRTSFKGSFRFWIRDSSGAHEASMDELRNIFTLSSDTIDKIRAFRLERIRHIQDQAGAQPLVGGGRLILHIVPISAFSSAEQIDLEAAHANHMSFRPIDSMGMSPRFNFDGFINARGGEQNEGYTQVYRSGIIEATLANITNEIDGDSYVPGLFVENAIFEVLDGYIDGLKTIGVAPPLVLMVTLEGIGGALYAVTRNRHVRKQHRIDRSPLLLPECVIDEYGSKEDYHRCIKPAFDALWNAIGYSGSQFFNENDVWVGEH